MLREVPGSESVQADLAITHTRLGDVRWGLGRLPEAEKNYQAALSMLGRLIEEHPASAAYQADQAKGLHTLGTCQHHMRRLAEAETTLSRALGVWETLARAHPDRPVYLYEQGCVLRSRAGVAAEASREQDAEHLLLRAQPLLEGLVRSDPAQARSASELGLVLEDRARLARWRQDWPAAARLMESALEYQEKAQRAEPSSPRYARCVRQHAVELARVRMEGGEYAASAAVLRERFLPSPDELPQAFNAFRILGVCRQRTGQDPRLPPPCARAAAECYREQARHLLRQAAASDPQPGRGPNVLARLLSTTPHPEGQDAPLAVELARQAVRAAPARPGYWNTLGIALFRAGDNAAAREAFERAMRLADGGTVPDWFFMAQILWLQGEQAEARALFDKAGRCMEKGDPGNEELKRFRAEAATRLSAR